MESGLAHFIELSVCEGNLLKLGVYSLTTGATHLELHASNRGPVVRNSSMLGRSLSREDCVEELELGREATISLSSYDRGSRGSIPQQSLDAY